MLTIKKAIKIFLITLFLLTANFKIALAAPVYPSLTLDTPVPNLVVVSNYITVNGTVSNADKLVINGYERNISKSGNFSAPVELDNIVNQINVTVYNEVYGTEASETRTVYYSFQPTIDITSHESGTTVNSQDIIIKGDVTPIDQSEIDSFTVNGTETPVNGGSFVSNPIILKTGTNSIKAVLKTKAINIPGVVNIPSREYTKTITIKYVDGLDINLNYPRIKDKDVSETETETVYANEITLEGWLDNYEGVDTVKVGDKETKVESGGYFEQDISLANGENSITITATNGSETVTKTFTINASYFPKDGSEMHFDDPDGQENKAFNDAIIVKLQEDSVDSGTSLVIKVKDAYLGLIPSQSAIVSQVFHVGWDEDEPIKPYKVTLKYDDVVSENQAHKVTMMFYDDKAATWKILGGVVDAKAHTISVKTTGSGYFAAATCYTTFSDVNHHWAKRDIEFLVARGAISGRQGGVSFQPDANITRAEFITCLVKGLGISPYSPVETSYYDVPSSHWAFRYIEAASRAGLISGVSYRAFAPNRTITREEAASILARAVSLKQSTDKDAARILSKFTDESKISPWARKDVATAVKGKIISGNDLKQFLPRRITTRAQAVSMIARVVEIADKNSNK